jgi:hypothetical protein
MRGRRRGSSDACAYKPVYSASAGMHRVLAFEGPCRICSEFARDGIWIKHESLILAQNERWRHA